jgi:hypothetical protein
MAEFPWGFKSQREGGAGTQSRLQIQGVLGGWIDPEKEQHHSK